jgi:hypothetical protein
VLFSLIDGDDVQSPSPGVVVLSPDSPPGRMLIGHSGASQAPHLGSGWSKISILNFIATTARLANFLPATTATTARDLSNTTYHLRTQFCVGLVKMADTDTSLQVSYV